MREDYELIVFLSQYSETILENLRNMTLCFQHQLGH